MFSEYDHRAGTGTLSLIQPHTGDAGFTRSLLLRVFTPATKSRKSSNGLNTLKPWFTTLRRQYEASDNKENFRPECKTPKKRSGAIRTPEFVADVVEIVKENPSKSIRKITKEMGTSRRTIGRTVKEDLNVKSYKLRWRQLLTQVQKERRKLKASALIDDLKHTSSGMLRFFSDEKIFVQDMKPNQQNNRWLSASPEEVPIVMHSKYPVHVMVLGVVSSDGDVMEPVLIPDGLYLGANSYVTLLDEHVKPWMDMVANGRP